MTIRSIQCASTVPLYVVPVSVSDLVSLNPDPDPCFLLNLRMQDVAEYGYNPDPDQDFYN